jgi:uncharacterized membrane protein YphA (DoxX/SURF4 family)
MNLVHRIDAWSERSAIKWVLLLRIILGLLLLFKGISFISHSQYLEDIIARSRFKPGGHWLAIAITWAHLFGGAMIIIGLLTRVAVIIQIPILIGAVFYIGSGVIGVDANPGLSIPVLVLLIFFLFEGGGPYSMDRYVKRKLL